MAPTFAVLYGRNMRQLPRIPTVIVFGVVMPLVQLILFGNIFSATTQLPAFQQQYPDVNYQAYIAPAIILFTCFIGMANSSAAFIVDLRTGYFDKLRTNPVSASGIIIARIMAEMTRVAAQATLVLIVAFALGARAETGIIGAIVMVLLAVLFSASTVGLFVTILAMKTRSDQATQSVFPLFFILIFLSTAFMPEVLLPDWLQTVVKYNPIDYLINALRSLMLDDWPWTDIAITLGASAVLATVLGLANRGVYRRNLAG